MFRRVGLIVLLFATCRSVLADLAAVQQAEDTARGIYIQKFNEFIKDKNVMGRATSIDGKSIDGGPAKARFDNDDGVSYRSDLTFHDFAFDTIDETAQKNKDAGGNNGGGAGGAGGNNAGQQDDNPDPTLYANVSPHGGLSAAGGSSALERKSYEWHKKYIQQDAKNAKQLAEEEEKTGIKFKSIFRTDTQEIVEDEDAGGGGNAGGGGAKKGKNKIKVERDTLRDEAEKEIADVGTKSFDTIDKAAKDEDEKDNPKVMPNLTFLYEAARRATQSLWNATLANLGQLRVNKAVTSANGNDAQLSEEAASCDDLQQQQAGKIAQIKDDGERKAAQEALQKQVKQCKEVAQTDFRQIAPRFEAGKDGNEALKEKGVKEESSRERDYRLQLGSLDQPEQDISNIPSNWKYDQKDSQAPVVLGFDENADAKDPENLTMKDQIGNWNDEVKGAGDDYEKAKQRIPGLQGSGQQVIDQGTIEGKSLLEINRPVGAMYEEFGVDKAPPLEPAAQNYDQLVQEQQNAK